jgi:calcineurin-like phosphoesterase family protein
MELNYRISHNIHGHIHEGIVEEFYKIPIEGGIKTIIRPDKRYKCVSCEQNDFTPQSLEELGIIR